MMISNLGFNVILIHKHDADDFVLLVKE